MLMLGINSMMTWMGRPAEYENPVHTAPRLTKTYVDHTPTPTSAIDGAPVLELGKKVSVWSQMGWHRRWERLPVRFTVFTTIAVVVATLFEVIPTFLIRSNVPTIATVKPYTPLELAGRHIFVSEGCYNCHSQMIRPIVSETKRYGEYSKPGEFIYDRPFQWGSRRIGPDLAREGGKQSSFWHWTHFENPENVSPGSVMPDYGHLLTEDMNYDAIAPHVKVAAYLGAEYTDEELNNTAEVAYKQAEYIAADIVAQGGPAKAYEKQAVALIAYLQRVGVDLFATEEPAAEETAEPADTDTESSEETAEPAVEEAAQAENGDGPNQDAFVMN